MISSVTSTGATSSPTLEPTLARPPSTRPSRSASAGLTWTVQRSLPLTSAGRLCIQELLERSWRRPIRTIWPLTGAPSSASRRGTSATISGGASSIFPEGVRRTLGEPRAHRARRRSRAGSASSFASVSPSGSAPNPSPNGPTRSMKSSRRSGPRRSPSAARSSSGARPSIGEPGKRDLAAERRCGRRARRGPRCPPPVPGRRRSPARRRITSHSCGLAVGARQDRRASSWRRCGLRAGRARCRSGPSRAARARGG